MTDAAARIAQRAEQVQGPDGEPLLLLDVAGADSLAAELCMSRREVEIAALRTGVIPRRYQRNIGTLGMDGQVALLEAAVSVIGLGGLGGVVCELLARIGIGELILVDGDAYDESNLNRQIHSTERNAAEAKEKASASRRRVERVNGAVSVRHHRCVVDESNARSLLGRSQVVVDCLDNIPDRFLLESTCRSLGIPLVHGAVAGMMGQVMVIFPGSPGLQHLYGCPDEAARYGVERSLGNLAVTVTATAALQCQELVKIVTGVGEPICDGVLYLDLSAGHFNRVRLS